MIENPEKCSPFFTIDSSTPSFSNSIRDSNLSQIDTVSQRSSN